MNISPFVLPIEVCGNIAGFLEPEDHYNLQSVNVIMNEAMNSDYTDLRPARQLQYEEGLNPENTGQILVPHQERMHIMSKSYFLRNASLVDKFKYYSGYTDLVSLKTFYAKC
jgi:hypothetical protein